MHLRLDNVWDYTHTHTRTPWSSRPVSHMAISNHGSGLKPVKTYCPAHRPSSVSELWAALGLTFPCFCRARWNLAGGLEAPTNGFVLLQSRERVLEPPVCISFALYSYECTSCCACVCARAVVWHFPFIFIPLRNNRPGSFRNDLIAFDLKLMFTDTRTKRCVESTQCCFHFHLSCSTSRVGVFHGDNSWRPGVCLHVNNTLVYFRTPSCLHSWASIRPQIPSNLK